MISELEMQLSVLCDIQRIYPGKNIDSIIENIKSILKYETNKK